MVQSLMQNFLTALKLLHLHQQLSQIITQEVKLLSLQGCFIVTYRLCNTKCKSAYGSFLPLRINRVHFKEVYLKETLK